ncbi:MAG: hypothetical protein KAT90_04525, partial [Gammaproteobacteria bacterium]|nr:hypothetical protein [Gammaproteobacteria bacterium]
FVVEGEKTADALLKINPSANVVTWMNGTKSVDRSNWNSLPEDRNYILVPDADHKKDKKSGLLIPSNEQLGYVAMMEVAKTLPNPASIRMVNTAEMGKQKDGWDLADAQESGWDSAKLISFIKENIEVYKTDIVFDDSHDSSDIVVKVDNANKVVKYDDTYFKCLGFLEKSHYFFHKPTGQVWSFLGKDLSAKSNMIMLAPLAWWAVMFPKGRGDSSVDWDGVADWLLRINEKIGVYDPEKIRYRGAWIDEGRPVMHLGDKIICDDKKYKLDEFETDYIYPKRGKLWNDHGTFLPKEESRKLIEVCRMARWEKDHYGDILAGWMFASLVCGILKFRSHLYLIGASGSGKSWVFEQIVRKALGEVPLYCTSKTTEAGIRK